MLNQVQKVYDIMQRDGGITHMTAQHYNIGCVRKVISTLRAKGVNILTVKRKDAEGKSYSRWTLAAKKHQPVDLLALAA